MPKELSGAQLAEFIKERQLKQVRNLRQEHKVVPKLVIVKSNTASQVIEVYVRMKMRYADDIGIEVEVAAVDELEMIKYIESANTDSNVHGIIVQLPLKDSSQTEMIVDAISPQKDVDGLGEHAQFFSATAEAIDWLLAGYNIELTHKRIAILGRGRLVGAPLEKLWSNQGHQVISFDVDSGDITQGLQQSDIIVTATGVPGRLTNTDIGEGAIVVDAGTASENGVVVGDVAEEVRERSDIMLTPIKGGVGPLTIAVLFDHVIQAALKSVGKL